MNCRGVIPFFDCSCSLSSLSAGCAQAVSASVQFSPAPGCCLVSIGATGPQAPGQGEAEQTSCLGLTAGFRVTVQMPPSQGPPCGEKKRGAQTGSLALLKGGVVRSTCEGGPPGRPPASACFRSWKN